MEFTAKITKSLNTVVHSSPHASRGKTYFSNFRRNVDRPRSLHITPPRKYSQVSFSRSRMNKSSSASKLKSLSRSGNILRNSQVQNSSKESPKQSKWISKVNNFESPSITSKKRSFSSLSLENSKDHYNVFSDDDVDDDEVFLSSKHDRMIEKRDLDKENNLRSPLSRSSPKVYSSSSTKKKKILNLQKSNILHDISPEKVQSFESEENIVNAAPRKTFKFRPYIGCESTPVKNEVSKSNCVEYPHLIGFPNFGNTCYLNAVLQTVISLHSFIVDLSTVLDSVNVSSTSLTHSLWNIIIARHKLDSLSVKNSLRTMKENIEKIDGSFSGFKMQDANEFLTQVLDSVKDEIDKSSPILVNNNVEENKCNSTSIFDSPSSSSPLSLEVNVKENLEVLVDEDIIFLTAKPKPDLEEGVISKVPQATENQILEESCNSLSALINPVSNNFEFELFESYRCLGCSATEGRRQKHFALYVNLPSDGSENIQSAVESYLSEDERELTCSKCQHNRASFLTSFVKLPRVLIVQMKRYEYKPEQLECIKVSSRVNINMWLHLDELISKDSSLPPKFATKSLRDLKCAHLQELNPSSELNLCGEALERPISPSASMPFVEVPKSDSDLASNEQKELEEVINRSLEDVGGDGTSAQKPDNPDKEEEELQEAIRLSLMDTGMCYSLQQPSEEPHDQEVSSHEETDENRMNSYHLLSVISHFGLTTCTGHYVSDVLNVEDGNWYHYDDESVSSVPESVVLSEGRQKNGYIFFYVHQDTYHELRNKKT